MLKLKIDDTMLDMTKQELIDYRDQKFPNKCFYLNIPMSKNGIIYEESFRKSSYYTLEDCNLN